MIKVNKILGSKTKGLHVERKLREWKPRGVSARELTTGSSTLLPSTFLAPHAREVSMSPPFETRQSGKGTLYAVIIKS